MRVAIDATPIRFTKSEKGGIYHYIINFISALKDIDDENNYVLFLNIFINLDKNLVNEVHGWVRTKDNLKTSWRVPLHIWRKLGIPVNLFKGIDLFHGLNSELYPTLKCKTVVTIHDLRAILVDESSFKEEWLLLLKSAGKYLYARRGYKKRHNFFQRRRKYLPWSIMKADSIIAVSEYSKRSIIENFDIREDKVKVVYHGVSPHFVRVEDRDIQEKVKRKYNIKKRYILYVGQSDPLKNLDGLIKTFLEIRKLEDYQLVLAGPMSWFSEIISLKIKESGHQNDIVITDFVPDEDLPVLYSGADVFVLPSLIEGFGIPLIEAMACGCPVVASNAGSIPEIVNDAAVLFDPYSTTEMVTAISRVISDKNLRDGLIEHGLRRAGFFTWEKTARDTLKVYRECLK